MPDFRHLEIPRDILGISSDVFGTAAGIAIVGPVLVGFVAGQLAPALVAALMAALLVVVYLLSRLRRETRRNARLQRSVAANPVRLNAMQFGAELIHAEFARAQSQLDAIRHLLDRVRDGDDPEESFRALEALSATEPQVPSAWLPDPHDLTTFALTPADFEALYSDACKRGLAELGPDATTFLNRVVLFSDFVGFLADTPRVLFESVSDLSMKRTMIWYEGSIDRVSMATLRRPVLIKHKVVKPWQVEPQYLELVAQSWRRMQTFHGVATLEAYPRPFPGNKSKWLVVYIALDDREPGFERFFAHVDGRFTELTAPPA